MHRWCAAVLVALLAPACHPADSRPVVVGAAGPWSLEYTAMARRGIELAAEEVNQAGGVRGRRLVVLQKDDSGSGAHAAAAAEAFVDDERVVAVVGHLNSGAMVSAAHVYNGRVAAVSPTATAPDITGISPWVFRVIASDSANGSALARFAAALRAPRAVVLYENNAYGRGLADAFRRDFRGALVGYDPIAASGAGVEPLVAYYKGVAPDLVFVAGTRESGLAVLREARRQRFAARFLGGDGWAQIAADTLAAEGVYVGVPVALENAQTPEARRFVQAFTRRFGAAPDMSAALAYDATVAIARAVAHAGPRRARVRDALAAGTPDSSGVTGRLRFRADGDPAATSVTLMRVERGGMVAAR